jgi:hypothetical protein
VGVTVHFEPGEYNMDTPEYWEDRLSPEDHQKASKALDAFRKKRKKDGTAKNILYEKLTNLGVTSEEADEIINLEMQDA